MWKVVVGWWLVVAMVPQTMQNDRWEKGGTSVDRCADNSMQSGLGDKPEIMRAEIVSVARNMWEKSVLRAECTGRQVGTGGDE